MQTDQTQAEVTQKWATFARGFAELIEMPPDGVDELQSIAREHPEARDALMAKAIQQFPTLDVKRRGELITLLRGLER